MKKITTKNIFFFTTTLFISCFFLSKITDNQKQKNRANIKSLKNIAHRIKKDTKKNLLQNKERVNFTSNMSSNKQSILDDGIDWERYNKEWIHRLKEILESHYNKKIATRKVKLYLQIKKKHENLNQRRRIYQKNNNVASLYLNLSEQQNITNQEQKEAKQKWKRSQILIKQAKFLYLEELKEAFGQDFSIIKEALKLYNKEISINSPHLSYDIGISI
ncbi:MAG: hypothetical protein N4A33_00945 [Bacteriovoracaceae bacterium]|jgi:hypothetical protein|nr:hypothetical protein [Bacteriovoracaceae bacterium]